MHKLGIWLAAGIIACYLWFRARKLEIIGAKNLPQSSEVCIVVSNHVDYVDPPLLWKAIGRVIRFWSKSDITKIRPIDRLLVWLMQELLGVIPVERNTADLTPVRKGSAVLASGGWVGIFPEGTRNKGEIPVLVQAYIGAALLARRTGALIIPVGIQGTRGLLNPVAVLSNIWQPWRLIRSHSVTVTIGKPFRLPDKVGRKGRESIVQDVHFILEQIAQLLPEEWRGVYSNQTPSAVAG